MIKKNINVKTFRLRYRKLTKNKFNIIDSYWPLIGINLHKNKLNLDEYFNNKSPIILEIGFGFGESLVNCAKKYKNLNFLGIEVYIPGICFCLNNIYSLNLNNVKIFYGNAINFFEYNIKNIFFNRINIFFPDPWPKRKHHKRRIIQKKIIKKISKNLILNGFFHILTDSFSYFQSIQKIFNKLDQFKDESKIMNFYFFNKNTFYTRFLNKANIKKKMIYNLIYKKIF
ncbi:tRNA (guanine-N(7)-)-methyltransferase [Buchnera aphidicola (Periphyllus testudinaceus)]|uniref:tRNA (guanosine(46)-N7)-methyltransferase TrmB n=1 Tax=Buchnera aphidicola TaxID=9 RepID=UPI0034644BDE